MICLWNIEDTYTDYVCTKFQPSIPKTRGVLVIGRYRIDGLSGFSGIFFAISGLRYRGRGRGLAKIFFALTREKNFRRRYVLRCHVTRFVLRLNVTEHGSAYVPVGCRVFNGKPSFACRSRVLPTIYANRVRAVRTWVVRRSRPAFNVRQHLFCSSVLEA